MHRSINQTNLTNCILRLAIQNLLFLRRQIVGLLLYKTMHTVYIYRIYGSEKRIDQYAEN